MQHFDPRNFLKHSAIALLRQFFANRHELLDLPWDELQEQREYDLIYHAWQALPESQRRQVQAVFHELWEVADERGVQSIAEELKTYAPQRAWEFAACYTRLNKVLWFYLHFPELWEQVSLFVRADWLSTSRYAVRRNSLPKVSLEVTPQKRESLAKALHDYYWPQEMRGRHCHVEHYSRSGGNEYFFAYLDNWPDTRLVMEENGRLNAVCQRDAFSVLYVYSPEDGSLELVSPGGKSVHHPLQQAFARSMFNLDVAPVNPLRDEYQLQPLLDPDFTYPVELKEGITQIRLTRIRLVPAASTLNPTTLELRFGPRISRRQWVDVIQQQLTALGIPRELIEVRHATFQLQLAAGVWGRRRTLTFSVQLPSACDLKTKPDELRDLGLRCLRRWGLLHD